MADNIEMQDEAPKKPRKRTPKKAVTTDAPKAKRGSKLPHLVKQEGKLVTISGSDAKLREMDGETKAKHGIKEITGPVGKPCSTEVCVITFKSPAAAKKFFEYAFTVESMDEEPIVTGSKTDWENGDLSNMLG